MNKKSNTQKHTAKTYKLLPVLILLGVLGYCAGAYQDNTQIMTSARSAINAVRKHVILARAVFDFKKANGVYPDAQILKLWSKLDRSKPAAQNEPRAREIFLDVYNEMPAFKDAGFTLTKNMGFSDGKFIYFLRTGFGAEADINGLISRAAPGTDYKKQTVNFSPLDMLIDYKDASPLHVRLKCLPLNRREQRVCGQVLNYFRNQKPTDAAFFIPQTRVEINDVTF